MAAAKKFRVGYRAFVCPTPYAPPDLLAIGRMVIPASSMEAAMKLALQQVPKHIGKPGCSVGIRFCKELK